MIEKITIKNFQSHKSSVLDLSPNVNVIIGSSDSGKSSIARAIGWALFNRPLGFSFKSHFSKKDEPVEVEIKFNDGILLRKKSHDQNLYCVNKERLETIGTDVPIKVLELHRLGKINYQSQFEKIFLLQDSPSEISKKINEILEIDLADELLKYINSSIFETRKEIKLKESEIERLRKEKDGYKYLDDLSRIIENLKLNLNKYNVLVERYRRLVFLASSIGSVLEEYKKILGLLKYGEYLERIKSNLEEYKKIQEKYSKLDKIIVSLREIEYELNKVSISDSLIERFTRTSSKIDELKKISEIWETCYSILSKVKVLNRKILESAEELKDLKERYINLLKKAKVCPLCGQTVAEKDLEKHIKL